MSLSNKIILLRKQKGLTQKDAAQLIGIKQSYLSKLENGHYEPSNDVLKQLYKAYDVNEKDLVEKKRNPNLYISTLGIIFSILIISAGKLAILYPQIYYTYEVSNISQSIDAENIVNFHLTDVYLGEKYIQTNKKQHKYLYTLISQRKVSQIENTWIIWFGLSFLLLFLFLFIKQFILIMQLNKPSHNEI